MKKYISIILSFFLIAFLASANGNTLYEHFKGKLPSLSERALLYEDIGSDKYVGSVGQNIKLHSSLDEPIFGALAFPPSTVEGTSTAGWTDDGSIVRLNTASDFVGIGTTNPGQKLTVQGGNAFISGSLTIAGGTHTFGNGTGTTTLSVVNSGNLGVGTTSPGAPFAVTGEALFNGSTTTVGNLNATSSITTAGRITASSTRISNVECYWPGTSGASGNVLSSDGGTPCVLSWVAQNADWGQLGETILGSANATTSVTGLAARQDLRIIVDIVSVSGAGDTPRLILNNDIQSGPANTTYGQKVYYNDVKDTGTTAARQSIDLRGSSGNSTTTAQYYVIDIVNIGARSKKIMWRGMGVDSTTFVGADIEGYGVWNNTSAQITSVRIDSGVDSVTQFGIGTRITVYGKKD